MASFPRISVVTSSYNQGRFIGRTIQSVLAQDYPNLEHIVVDGMSTDDTPEVLARYPHLRVIREPDSGQAEAINKGFRLATGDVYCFLNSDDTFLPGALHRVAREIDPARGRHVVMGRCAFVDEDDNATGVEHPSGFIGHDRVLEVWRIHCIPQPATFWTAEVWRRCGPLDEREQLVLDYDLMCRISRYYHFHFIDQVLATYRLHKESKSCANASDLIYEHATRVSRKYWGRPWSLRYWRMLLSMTLFNYRGRRRHRAAELHEAGRQARAARRWMRRWACEFKAACFVPEVTLRRLWLLHAAARLRRWLPRIYSGARTWNSPQLPLVTSAWRNFTGLHADGTVGPVFRTAVEISPGRRWLHVTGIPVLGRLPLPLQIQTSLDGCLLAKVRLTEARPFSIKVSVANFAPGT